MPIMSTQTLTAQNSVTNTACLLASNFLIISLIVVFITLFLP
jgi:hypothetical protein